MNTNISLSDFYLNSRRQMERPTAIPTLQAQEILCNLKSSVASAKTLQRLYQRWSVFDPAAGFTD